MTVKGTVLITGASSGIGWQLALESVKAGYHVILVARRLEKLKELQALCDQLEPNSATIYQLDLLDIEQVDHVLSKILEQHTIDIVINNAGMGLTKDVVETSYAQMQTVFQLNVMTVMYLSKRLAIHMLDNGGGHIIQLASLAGKVATPKTAIYSASKAAVIGFSDALRQELKAANIHVTTVNLGPVDTEFFSKVGTAQSYFEKMKPVMLDSQTVAQKVVKYYGKPKREINLPWTLNLGAKLYQLFPNLADTVINKTAKK